MLPASAYFGSVKQGNTQILVKQSSPIQTFKDLAGKTVSTVNLQGLFQLGVWNAVTLAGGDVSSIKSLPTQQQDEANALNAGQVDAAVFQEPWLTLAKQGGGLRSIGNPFALLTPFTTAGVLIAGNQTIAEKPDVLKKFLVAWQQATTIAQNKQAFTRQMLTKYTGLSPDVINKISLPKYHDRDRPGGAGADDGEDGQLRLDQDEAELRHARLGREVGRPERAGSSRRAVAPRRRRDGPACPPSAVVDGATDSVQSC